MQDAEEDVALREDEIGRDGDEERRRRDLDEPAQERLEAEAAPVGEGQADADKKIRKEPAMLGANSRQPGASMTFVSMKS